MARLVFVTIPTGKREAVLHVLHKEGIDYTVTDETSGRDYTCAVHFPLPTNAVEPVLDSLRETGLNDDAITVTVETESVASRDYDHIEERFTEDSESPEQIAKEELQSAAKDLVPASMPIYAGMTIVSAIIATAGLLLDSTAVVVGSIVSRMTPLTLSLSGSRKTLCWSRCPIRKTESFDYYDTSSGYCWPPLSYCSSEESREMEQSISTRFG